MSSRAPVDDMAARVRALRDRLELSQEQLAQQLRVSFATVNRWEGGRHRMSAAGRERFELLEATARPTSAAAPLGAAQFPELSSTFVGRESEVAAVIDALGTHRLVSLIGPPGVGKTRLALEVCRQLSAETVVGYVDLRGRSDPAEVDERVNAALGSGRQLLVLDGVEHCAESASATVSRLLPVLTGVRLIVTSQRALGVHGEHIYRVPTLLVPPADAKAAEVTDSEAGQLFVDRARDAAPDFAVTDDVAPGIADLCRLVEGVPLAVEVLAGWAGVLSVGQTVERHRDLLYPASSGSRSQVGDSIGRLREAVADSFALLEPEEQRLVGSLSMIAGSFSLADAAAIAQLDDTELVVALRRLAACSWLIVEPGEPTNSFRMLRPLRHFGAMQLAEGEHQSVVRARHAHHFAALASASEHGLAGVDRTEWVARMTQASVDVDAALAWAMSDGDDLLGLTMSAALWLWWLTTGRLADGRRWVRDFLDCAVEPPAELAARAECAAAVLAVESGDYAAAVEYATRALTGFDRLGDADGSARAATALGSAERYLGRHDSARRYFEQALAFRRELGDDRGLASAFNNMALLALDGGDLVATRSLFEESLLVKRRLGEPRTVAIGLANLSDVLIRAGLVGHALDALREAADIAADLGDTQLLATIACNLGDAACTSGDYFEAIRRYQTSIDAYRASGGAHDLVPALCGMARALHALGRTHDAVVRLREAEALSTVNDNTEHLAEVRAALTDIGHATTISLPGGLTARQAEILRLVANGASNKSVAEGLHISVATVERHLATIYRKLGLHGRVDAARYALQHGLAVTGPEAAPQTPPEYMVPRISKSAPSK